MHREREVGEQGRGEHQGETGEAQPGGEEAGEGERGKGEVQLCGEITCEEWQALSENGVGGEMPVIGPKLRAERVCGEAGERCARADEFEHGGELPGADQGIGVQTEAEDKAEDESEPGSGAMPYAWRPACCDENNERRPPKQHSIMAGSSERKCEGYSVGRGSE